MVVVRVKHPGGRPTKYNDKMIQEVYAYLESVAEDEEYEFHKTRGLNTDTYEEKLNVKLPTIQGLSLWIGCNIDTLHEWGKVHPEFSDALQDLKKVQHDKLIEGSMSGKYNSTIAKLMLSSNHGYVERKDVTTDGDKLNPNDAQKGEANKAIDQLLGGRSNKKNAAQ